MKIEHINRVAILTSGIEARTKLTALRARSLSKKEDPEAARLRDFAVRWKAAFGFPVNRRSLKTWLGRYELDTLDIGLQVTATWYERRSSKPSEEDAHRYASVVMRNTAEAADLDKLLGGVDA